MTQFQPPAPQPVELGEGHAALSLHGPVQGVTMAEQHTGPSKVLPTQIGVAHVDVAQPPLPAQFAQTPFVQAPPLLWTPVQVGPGRSVHPAATKGVQPSFHTHYVPAASVLSDTPHCSHPPGTHERYPHVQAASPVRTDTHESWVQQVNQNAFNILKYGQTFGTWTLKHEREHATLEKRLAALEGGGAGDGTFQSGQDVVRGSGTNDDTKNGSGGTSRGGLRGGLDGASSACLNCSFSARSNAIDASNGGSDASNNITRTRLAQRLDELGARVYKLENNGYVQSNYATGPCTNLASGTSHNEITIITSEQDRQISQNTHEIQQQKQEIAELKRQVDLLTGLVRNGQTERGEPNVKRAKTSRARNPRKWRQPLTGRGRADPEARQRV